MGAVTKLNALRRLTMKPHAENTAPRKHKEFRVRLYDQDRVVGYVGWIDFLETKVALERMADTKDGSRPITFEEVLDVIEGGCAERLRALRDKLIACRVRDL